MTGSIWDLSTTPGSNTALAGINIAPGCPSSSVGPALREYLAEVKGALIALASGGTADAITATAAPAPIALTDGMRVLVRAGAANATTTPTFQLNALGTAGTIKKLGGTALVAGDVSGAGHAIELEYVSSDNHWELLNPKTPVGATVASLADATNGGLNFSGSTGAITASLKTSDLTTKATPTLADSLVVQDAAASNTPKTATVLAVMQALFTPITASLGADVALNNTASYFDGPSVAQGATGTWFVSGTVTVAAGGSTSTINVKLWDGTTVIASAVHHIGGTLSGAVSLSGFITSPAGNLRISVKDSSDTSGTIKANGSTAGVSKDSTITAVRIG